MPSKVFISFLSTDNNFKDAVEKKNMERWKHIR